MSLAEDPNLEGLYPFLHGKKQDPLLMNNALLESVRQKADHHHQVIDAFFTRNGQEVVAAAGAIAAVYRGKDRPGSLFGGRNRQHSSGTGMPRNHLPHSLGPGPYTAGGQSRFISHYGMIA